MLEAFRTETDLKRREYYAVQLFEELESPLAAFLYTSEPTDADDLMQEVAVAIVTGLQKCTSTTPSMLRGWCFRIASNKLNTLLRKKIKDKQRREHLSTEALEEIPEDGSHCIDWRSRMDLDQILGMVDQKKKGCRRLIWGFHVLELDQKEMAKDLDLEIRALGQRISRCMDEARKIARRLK